MENADRFVKNSCPESRRSIDDEPTNHLDLESIVWLESWIRAYKGILLMTSHDRDFMNGLVSKIIEVANQTITTYSGNYDFYEKERDIRKVQLVAAARRQDEMLAKEEEFIARFAAGLSCSSSSISGQKNRQD
jgi:ATP-binding cassette subfamily F protein 3